ncbi:hypothetical protein DPMN_132364 [Dreissena polymorpha]|uniref:Uncharacterized protein n=1 Tax=Dreissena polymorpha TaxID=45954 RepID=A0A9D4FRF2_DREPO|nr:hypothetical protein DPMN_132364 [Dreissena polymorpha]
MSPTNRAVEEELKTQKIVDYDDDVDVLRLTVKCWCVADVSRCEEDKDKDKKGRTLGEGLTATQLYWSSTGNLHVHAVPGSNNVLILMSCYHSQIGVFKTHPPHPVG